MITLADTRRWDPASLETVLAGLVAARDNLLEMDRTVTGPMAPIGWQGDAAALAAADKDRLAARIRQVADGVTRLHPGIGRAADAVTTLRRGIDDTEAVAAAAGFAITPDGAVVDTRPPIDVPGGVLERASAQAGIASRLAQLLQQAAVVDSELAALLTSLASEAAAATAAGPSGRPTDPDGLRAYWMSIALHKAGIDADRWDPSLGAGELSELIEKVYSYYGDLYLQHPELQWAGMANMIGPSFAAGFSDLDMMRDAARALASIPGTPPGMRELALASDADLKFYETTFLSMQKEIFFDQAMMHEAYLNGGMPAIHELRQAGLIDARTELAWSRIDEGSRTGNQSLLADGNTLLLQREQYKIIKNDYEDMYNHPGTGPAFTYLMTAVGEPSIPGAKSFGEYQPLSVTTQTPGPQHIPFTGWDNPLQGEVTVTTPLPDGNIADFDQRWRYITDDTLPAYQRMLREHPDEVRAIVGSDVGDRIEDYRLEHRIDDLAAQYASGWDVDFDQ